MIGGALGPLFTLLNITGTKMLSKKVCPFLFDIPCTFLCCSLYPGDVYAFTRRPTFLIVDSDNSSSFAAVPQHFEQPLVVLMSPTDVPSTFRGKRQRVLIATPTLTFQVEDTPKK